MAAVMKPHHPIIRISLGLLARQAESHQHGQSHRAPKGGKAQECFANLVVSIGHNYARDKLRHSIRGATAASCTSHPSRSTVASFSPGLLLFGRSGGTSKRCANTSANHGTDIFG